MLRMILNVQSSERSNTLAQSVKDKTALCWRYLIAKLHLHLRRCSVSPARAPAVSGLTINSDFNCLLNFLKPLLVISNPLPRPQRTESVSRPKAQLPATPRTSLFAIFILEGIA